MIGVSPSPVFAQTIEAHISVVSVSPPRVRVTGKRDAATRVWSFRNSYAGMLGLGDRIENLSLTDASGIDVPVRKLAPGEYEAAREALNWTYEIKLEPPTIPGDASFVSWLSAERGFLMLGDLLPTGEKKSLALVASRVRLSLPATWNAFTNELKRSDGEYDVSDVDDAIFFIGKGLRERRDRVGGTECTLITEATWAFSDQDVLAMVTGIINEYASSLGANPGQRITLMLSHFPNSVGAERWSAETRGHTVTLLSGQSPSKIAGLAQLSTPLTHELFHLWVPNGLQLAGNYDWFYEGFTLYKALCVSLRLGYLTFQDYLNALGRAFDTYSDISEGRKMSLIDASKRRWTGPSKLVYQKGMLVAFLYDLTLRYSTNGKRSLEDIYRMLFKNANLRGSRKDGNEVLISLLKSEKSLEDLVQSYIEGAIEIDLQSTLAPFGLKVIKVGNRTQIVASDKLDGHQRDLLSAFGYNGEPRKSRRRTS